QRVDKLAGGPLDPDGVPLAEVRSDGALDLVVGRSVVQCRQGVAAVASAVLGEVDLGGPSTVGRPEESDAGDPVALVHAEADQILAEGLRERPGAGETTRHPPVAESGFPVPLQPEHAAPDG